MSTGNPLWWLSIPARGAVCGLVAALCTWLVARNWVPCRRPEDDLSCLGDGYAAIITGLTALLVVSFLTLWLSRVPLWGGVWSVGLLVLTGAYWIAWDAHGPDRFVLLAILAPPCYAVVALGFGAAERGGGPPGR